MNELEAEHFRDDLTCAGNFPRALLLRLFISNGCTKRFGLPAVEIQNKDILRIYRKFFEVSERPLQASVQL